MKSPPSMKKRFQVYDFNEDDERVEKTAANLLGKYDIPKTKLRKTTPLTKYTFLECFAQGNKSRQKKTINEPIDVDKGVVEGAEPLQILFSKEPIDVDVGVARGNKSQQIVIGNEPIDIDDEVVEGARPQQILIHDAQIDFHVEVGSKTQQEVTENFVNNDNAVKHEQTPREHEAFREVAGRDKYLHSNSLDYENEQVGASSEDDECIAMKSSTSCFAFPENEGEQVAECGFGGNDIDTANSMVVVYPDFIIYRDTCCTACQLTFACSSIKVKSSTVNGTKGTFNFEWDIGEITKIESKWCREVESAMIHHNLKSKYCTGAENANEISGTELLRFVVYNQYWSKVEEAIKSLDVRYKDIWHDNLVEDEENAISGQKSRLFSREYLLEFDEPFEDVIYPKGDPDAVIISKRDVELLQPHTFINDTIIDFYIKYLKNKIQPEEQHRFHFFNSFFFRKLVDLDKNPSSVCEGKEAFQRVRKWTRKVNIFEKDYVFIPVNYSFHWSLIVICHPGAVVSCKDNEIEKLPKIPCILHMDSLKGSHKGLQNLVQSYLCEEWKERHSNIEDDVPSKFSSLRFLPLELPQQENSFDCGLFLLHYVECFLREAPSNFSPFNMLEFSNFLNRDWFPPWEASRKRADIKKLIHEICGSHLHNDSSADCDEYPSPQLWPDKNGQKNGYEIGSQNLRPPETTHQSYSSISDAEKGNASSNLAAFSQSVKQQSGNQGFHSAEIYEPQFSATPVSDGGCRQEPACHKRSIILPTEEVEEIKVVAHSPSEVPDFQRIDSLATESPTTPYISKDLMVSPKATWNKQLSMDLEEQNKFISQYQDLSKLTIDEDQSLVVQYEGSGHLETTNKLESSSTPPSWEYATCVVEDSEEEDDGVTAFLIDDSQEENGMQVDRQNKGSPSR